MECSTITPITIIYIPRKNKNNLWCIHSRYHSLPNDLDKKSHKIISNKIDANKFVFIYLFVGVGFISNLVIFKLLIAVKMYNV